MGDRALMELQVRVLFRHDRRGRLRSVNEPPYAAPPRVFLGFTRDGTVVRWRDDADVGLARQATGLAAGDEWHLDDLVRLAGGGGPAGALWLGPAFVFPPGAAWRARDQVSTVRVTRESASVLKEHFPYARREWRWRAPCVAVVRDGRAVAVCLSARQTAAAAEAGLHTVAAQRGHGYGAAAARAWAAAVQAQGRVALYSTSAQNLASQGVARRLGLRQYGIDVHVG
jgi:RimJ/RimL family protein N-acetyltransferase